MASLKKCFNLGPEEVVAFIGSGGKTTLLSRLSESYRDETVFAGTTTKLAFPLVNTYDTLLTADFTKLAEKPAQGITVAGEKTPDGQKLGALSEADFDHVLAHFPKIFLECDGSKCLPLKAWNETEPVIPGATSVTVGIVPIDVIGKSVTAENIHRFPLFLENLSAQLGEIISPQLLAEVIESPKGLFQKAQGRKILYLSHGEKEYQRMLAEEVVRELSADFLADLDQVILGDSLKDQGCVLWQRIQPKKA